jgi:hypothetical protein
MVLYSIVHYVRTSDEPRVRDLHVVCTQYYVCGFGRYCAVSKLQKTLKLKSVSKTYEKDFEFVCGVVVLMYILSFSESVGERVVYIYRLTYCT